LLWITIISSFSVALALGGAALGLSAASLAVEDGEEGKVIRAVLCPRASRVEVQRSAVGIPASRTNPYGYQMELNCFFADGSSQYFDSTDTFNAFFRATLERGVGWAGAVFVATLMLAYVLWRVVSHRLFRLMNRFRFVPGGNP
jgi:hypothetical protein